MSADGAMPHARMEKGGAGRRRAVFLSFLHRCPTPADAALFRRRALALGPGARRALLALALRHRLREPQSAPTAAPPRRARGRGTATRATTSRCGGGTHSRPPSPQPSPAVRRRRRGATPLDAHSASPLSVASCLRAGSVVSETNKKYMKKKKRFACLTMQKKKRWRKHARGKKTRGIKNGSTLFFSPLAGDTRTARSTDGDKQNRSGKKNGRARSTHHVSFLSRKARDQKKRKNHAFFLFFLNLFCVCVLRGVGGWRTAPRHQQKKKAKRKKKIVHTPA